MNPDAAPAVLAAARTAVVDETLATPRLHLRWEGGPTPTPLPAHT